LTDKALQKKAGYFVAQDIWLVRRAFSEKTRIGCVTEVPALSW
jgi:hypothetical protein